MTQILNIPGDENIRSVMPGGIKDLEIFVDVYHRRSRIEITEIVNEISIYENIFNPVLSGWLSVIDNSGMLSTFPFIGQENLTFVWERDERLITRSFKIIEVNDVSSATTGTGAYVLKFISEEQFINSFSLFSRAYEGFPQEIIAEIYEEFFGGEIEMLTEYETEIAIAFPWIKPLQAIHMITKNMLAIDGTPSFLFPRFYEETPALASYRLMLEEEPITTVNQKRITNQGADDGITENVLDEIRNQIYDQLISSAFNMSKSISGGALASTSTVIDLTSKKIRRNDFDYRENAPPISVDWVYDLFGHNGVPIYKLPLTKNIITIQNNKAFDTGFPNLTGDDEFEDQIMNSWKNRMNIIDVKVNMDSIAFTLDEKIPFSIGKVIEYVLPVFAPPTQQLQTTEWKNKIVSGKYLVSAINHNINQKVYTMSIQLIKDGLGEEANLYAGSETTFDLVANTGLSIDQAIRAQTS